jgi:hypothetical protein
MQNTKRKLYIYLVIAVIGFAFAIYKKQYEPKQNFAAHFIIMNFRMTPAVVTDITHPVMFTFHLKDRQNQPITDAKVELEVTMNHAGMTPIKTEAIHDQNGFYKTNVTLSMLGDWVIFVTVTKADGTIIKKEFPFSTSGK